MTRSIRIPIWLIVSAATVAGLLAGLMLRVHGAEQIAAPAVAAPSTARPDTVLGELAMLCNAQTRSVSAENPTGGKGMGAMAIPNPADPDLPHSAAATELGQGWKVRPFLKPRAGQTVTLMDVDGPGVIQHVWIVPGDIPRDGRSSVLRFYWDGEQTPSVEVPVADFFAVGHARFAPVNSHMVTAMPLSGLSCFWPMPFRKHAKVTFSNDAKTDIEVLAYQITYALTEVPEEAGYFHAQWRRAAPFSRIRMSFSTASKGAAST